MSRANRPALAPVFVVSTGRCGSTLLSSKIRLHPQILSVSEFFAYLGPGGVRAPRVSGEAAFRRLNTPRPPCGRSSQTRPSASCCIRSVPGRRYGVDDLPPIMCTALPHLTCEHEQLSDELGPALRARRRHRLTDHYRFVLEWLRSRFGRRVVGRAEGRGALPVAPVPARHFPDARFVYVY